MKRKQDGLYPIGSIALNLSSVPLKSLREATLKPF